MSITVTMYAKDTCPYCRKAEALLRERGCTDLRKLRIDEEPLLREQMIQRTGARTVPQIFLGELHVGGCDQLLALDGAGHLAGLLHPAEAAR